MLLPSYELSYNTNMMIRMLMKRWHLLETPRMYQSERAYVLYSNKEWWHIENSLNYEWNFRHWRASSHFKSFDEKHSPKRKSKTSKKQRKRRESIFIINSNSLLFLRRKKLHGKSFLHPMEPLSKMRIKYNFRKKWTWNNFYSNTTINTLLDGFPSKYLFVIDIRHVSQKKKQKIRLIAINRKWNPSI